MRRLHGLEVAFLLLLLLGGLRRLLPDQCRFDHCWMLHWDIFELRLIVEDYLLRVDSQDRLTLWVYFFRQHLWRSCCPICIQVESHFWDHAAFRTLGLLRSIGSGFRLAGARYGELFRFVLLLNKDMGSVRSALLIDKALLHVKQRCTGWRSISLVASFHRLVFVQELLDVDLFIRLDTLQFLTSGHRCGLMGLMWLSLRKLIHGFFLKLYFWKVWNEDASCWVHFSDLELFFKFSYALRRKVWFKLGTSDIERFVDRHDAFDSHPFASLALSILEILDEHFSLRFDLLDMGPNVRPVMSCLIVMWARLDVSLLRFGFL